MSGSFYTCKCPRCGSWFVQETRKELTEEIVCSCKLCEKTFKLFLKKRKDAGAQAKFIGPFDCVTATRVVQDIKKQEATKNGELFVEELSTFQTYEVKQ